MGALNGRLSGSSNVKTAPSTRPECLRWRMDVSKNLQGKTNSTKDGIWILALGFGTLISVSVDRFFGVYTLSHTISEDARECLGFLAMAIAWTVTAQLFKLHD